MDRFQKQFHGRLRHSNKASGLLHTLRVLVWTEYRNALVVGGTQGFKSFVALLAVVEAGSHAVDTEEGGGDELRGSPFSGMDGVGGLDVAVDCWG